MLCPMPECQAALSEYMSLKRCNRCGYEDREGRITFGTIVPSLPEANGTVESKPNIRQPRKPYRSTLKRVINAALLQELVVTDIQVCRWLDEEGIEPATTIQTLDRTFESAYRDPKIKPRLASVISKVRRQLRDDNLL
jgi:hypothetical protein